MYAVTVELVDRPGGLPPDPSSTRSEVDRLVATLLAAGVEHVAVTGSGTSGRVTVFVRAADHASAEREVRGLLCAAGDDGASCSWRVAGDVPGT